MLAVSLPVCVGWGGKYREETTQWGSDEVPWRWADGKGRFRKGFPPPGMVYISSHAVLGEFWELDDPQVASVYQLL